MADSRICRNVKVSGRRTSLSLEPYIWDCLDDVCRREGLTINALCTLIDQRRGDAALTAMLRVVLLRYFRAAAELSCDGPLDKNSRLLLEIERAFPGPCSQTARLR